MKPTTQPLDLVSALADGQLSGDAFSAAVDACSSDPDMVAQWSTYHLIGDVLRSPAMATPDAGHAFAARFASRLALESVPASTSVSSVSPIRSEGVETAPMSVAASAHAPAANDFRWKMVAGVASLTAVAAIAWSMTGLFAPPAGPQLAQQTGEEQILVASPSAQGTMVRDARLEEMLAAHKQFGGTSALQVPSGFLRNATFETSQGAAR